MTRKELKQIIKEEIEKLKLTELSPEFIKHAQNVAMRPIKKKYPNLMKGDATTTNDPILKIKKLVGEFSKDIQQLTKLKLNTVAKSYIHTAKDDDKIHYVIYNHLEIQLSDRKIYVSISINNERDNFGMGVTFSHTYSIHGSTYEMNDFKKFYSSDAIDKSLMDLLYKKFKQLYIDKIPE